MIKIDNLSYSFPEKDLYKNISFTLETDAHAAFIGTNGSGKSTLIDMIMDTEKYLYDGTIENSPNCRIGYVQQFSQNDKMREITVFDYICEEYNKLQSEITSICTQMETSSDIETLLEKYQEALDALDAIGGDEFENNVNKKLNLTNLMKHKDLMISELSGGEFKLVQVMKGMLNNPDLIIMDEPDVFLDFENLNSLKNLINSHKGTMLVITHNRYLLNNCFDKIIHLENMEVQEFDGNYIDYNFSLLQTKIELQELAAADTAEIQRNDKLIDRLRELATENAEQFRGKTLRARVKIQERLEQRRIKAPFLAIKEPDINLNTDNVLDEETIVLKLNNYNALFDNVLLEDVNFEIKSTDKVAIIGSNGTGKTTLMQDIFSYINNKKSIEVNDQVEMAYLSQLQHKTLNDSNTIREEFIEAGFKNSDEIMEHISKYGFEDREILSQEIGTLSGGEQNMLQLAKISVSNANMLLLDEPTSHLDTYSQIALEKAIKNYNGAILMVSHDFYSIVNCMDYILYIEDKKIRRMNMKTFKKMVYANYFDKDYLEIEHNKKQLEIQIELALRENDFDAAKDLCEQLENLVKLLRI
ncbi:ABC-F family ATP-binding cassette domain-containing protein [Clostridium butyricum]|uniref:ABC-F family ATP-binding cassette domain-containing protein n=1 Tax=Clostridium butyricum TaxID=1492 RepID=UPI0003D5BB45|nr:MAG: ABC transporter, ATP-binding protein [Clostridium butyricum DORA_1]MDU1006950.1 ATP-binding cassette domain-containing protein [Clostridium butyricum]MDU1508121.1 ATP-binding cassette domain-containing protein [Clostridium butyricum]MDU4801572.1 ATP-binding cassette domain-containing protein [Clostridium butyricum]